MANQQQPISLNWNHGYVENICLPSAETRIMGHGCIGMNESINEFQW
jgi:hypothetical protein